MLFLVNKNDFFQENPEAYAIKEFAAVPEYAMKYICMVYDYESPYRKMEMDTRKKIAMDAFITPVRPSYEKNITANESKYSAAVSKFLEINFDEDADTLDSVRDGIRDIKAFLRMPSPDIDAAQKKANIIQKLPTILEAQKDAESILNLRKDAAVDVKSADERSDKEISLLDEENEQMFGNE